MCCVDQADEADKEIQVHHMGAIYGGTFLTIVALEGTDPTAGLPRIRLSAGNPALPYMARQLLEEGCAYGRF